MLWHEKLSSCAKEIKRPFPQFTLHNVTNYAGKQPSAQKETFLFPSPYCLQYSVSTFLAPGKIGEYHQDCSSSIGMSIEEFKPSLVQSYDPLPYICKYLNQTAELSSDQLKDKKNRSVNSNKYLELLWIRNYYF